MNMDHLSPIQLKRKEDQASTMAELAKQEGDTKDADRYAKLAQAYSAELSKRNR